MSGYAGVLLTVLVMISGVVAASFFWLLVSGLMHLVTRFFGGTRPFSGMLAAVGAAQVPFVVSGLVQIPPVTGLQVLLTPEGPCGTTRRRSGWSLSGC